jgi:molybdate transport system regulatory protein
MKLTYKIWLDNNGGSAFGEGPYRLLKGVELTGSLWEAAAGLGMAYSKARRLIQGCERSLGFALTLRKKGGVSGGSSEVTTEAIELMRMYESLRPEIEDAIAETYKKHFGHSVLVELYAMITQKRGRKKQAEQLT